MYNEFRSLLRNDWKYAYKGSELLPFAEKKLAGHTAREREARNAASALLSDHSISRADKRVTDAEKAIESEGNLAEQCRVWVHQFHREGDRDFQLALGDVVYFGIA